MQVLFRTLEAGLGLVFLGTVAHHVALLDFKPLAALCLPILVIYLTFSSHLYTRGRSAPRGKRVALEAAERVAQATVWHLLGVIVGTTLYALLTHFGLVSEGWLALFLVPAALMLFGLVFFLRGLWAIAPRALTFQRW